MVVRSKSVSLSRRVQFDVPAHDMGEWTRLQKVDNPECAFTISGGVFNQQPAWKQEISGKKESLFCCRRMPGASDGVPAWELRPQFGRPNPPGQFRWAS